MSDPLKLGDITLAADAIEAFGCDLLTSFVDHHRGCVWGQLQQPDAGLQDSICKSNAIAPGQVLMSKWPHPAISDQVVYVVTRYDRHTTVMLAP